MENWKEFIEKAERMFADKVEMILQEKDHATQIHYIQELADGAKKIRNIIKTKRMLLEEQEHIEHGDERIRGRE